jgi:hypothetical protein
MNNSKIKLQPNRIIILSIIFLMLLSANSSHAQARWQADVSITSVTIGAAGLKKVSRVTDNINKPQTKVVQPVDDNLKCTITIHNENDDDARGTMMVVVLPVEVSVVAIPSNATLDPSVTATQNFAGHIIFNIGHMTVGQNEVGAYAYSDSPDPNPANNYKDATY